MFSKKGQKLVDFFIKDGNGDVASLLHTAKEQYQHHGNRSNPFTATVTADLKDFFLEILNAQPSEFAVGSSFATFVNIAARTHCLCSFIEHFM